MLTQAGQADTQRGCPPTFIIFFIEYARAIVTASGKPSGTATTTMVTAYRKNCTGPFWLILAIGKPLFSTHLQHAPCNTVRIRYRQTNNSKLFFTLPV